MAVIQKIATIFKKTPLTLQNAKVPKFVAANLEAVTDKSAQSIFTKILNRQSEFEEINYVDDIIQKYNMCTDNPTRKKVVKLLSAKKQKMEKAEKLLDEVNQQNGLYTSLVNTSLENTSLKDICYSKDELSKVEKELQKFYEEVFCPQAKPQRKSHFSISKNNIGGHGCFLPQFNTALIGNEILTKPLIYKVVDKTTGKTVDDINCLWQIHMNYRGVTEEIQEQGLKNVKLVLMNKEERLKSVKSSLAHENFHAIQFNNMFLHPEIGRKGIDEAYNQIKYPNLIQKFIPKVYNIFTNMNFIRKNPKLEPGTEVYTQTLDQYKTFKKWCGSDEIKYYYESATELDAYNKERLFAIKNNLLI